ncbi:MAG: MmgE/PrpD family protein [Xanthobacteraceae bacterium]
MSAALQRLGRSVAALKSDGATDALLQLHVTDSLGAWIASTGTPEGLRLLRFRAAQHQQVLALDLATRCALARLSEIDDIHLASMTTPGAIIVPGALTLAVALPGVAKQDVSAAMLAGYEVMLRLGRAIDGPNALYRGIWPTYFTAPLGIAATAARLLGLSAGETTNALSLALSLAAPGVGHHNAATTSRWLAVGHAASSGLSAALAAQAGFTADHTLLDGNFTQSVYGLSVDGSALDADPVWPTSVSEVSFKPWCAARQTMAATQALREIMDAGVAAQAIEQIQAWVLPPHRRMIDHGVVAGDRASHLTSVQYNMTLAATDKDAMLAVGPSSPPAPAVLALMDKITVQPEDSLLTSYPRVWPARVRVLAGGQWHEREVSHIPGDPQRPFNGSAVEEKFLRVVTPVLGTDRARRVLGRCGNVLTSGEFASLVSEIEQGCESAGAARGLD